MLRVFGYFGILIGVYMILRFGLQFLVSGLAYTLAQNSEKAQLMLYQSGTKLLIGVGLVWFLSQLLATIS